MACGSLDLFPAFFEKYSKNSFLLLVSDYPIDLTEFEQYSVSIHNSNFCNSPNCQYHILVYSTHLSYSDLSLQCNFSYQSVDCLFTVFKFYFMKILELKGFIFQKLLSAIDFHKSLPSPVLTSFSVSKKRLLRKKFKTKSRKSTLISPRAPETCTTAILLSKISLILLSSKREELLETIDRISKSL